MNLRVAARPARPLAAALLVSTFATGLAACGDVHGSDGTEAGLVLGDASAEVAEDVALPEIEGQTDEGRIELVDAGSPDADAAADAPGDVAPDADAADVEGPELDVHDAATPIALRAAGNVSYEDRVFDRDGFTGELVQRPARGVRVQLLYPTDEVLGEVDTLDDGTWQIEAAGVADPEGVVAVRVLADARIGAARVSTVDRSAGALYALRLELARGSADVDIAGVELVARADGPLGGALNIVDVIWGAWAIMPELAAIPTPRLTVAWHPGVPFACGSCYANNRISLGGATADPDEYDDDIVLHEFAHFFVAHLGRDDSPGGPHRDRVVEPRLAWGEGLAYFLAGVFSDRHYIVDNFDGARRLVDMEAVTVDGGSAENLRGTSDGTWLGDLREEIVAGVLWDAHDQPSEGEPWDALELGREGSLAVVREMRTDALDDVGARGTDLADWMLAAACSVDEADAASLGACAAALDYPWEPLDVVCPGKGDAAGGFWPDPAALLRPLAGARVTDDRGQLLLELPAAD